MQLHLFPNGSRLWRLAYRIHGKQKLLALGAYPAITLQAARREREALKARLADGDDPAVERRLAKIEAKVAATNTFRAVAEELTSKKIREGRSEATMIKTGWLLDFALPALGERPIADISAAEVLDVLRRVEQRGTYESARRLRLVIGEVFRYAIATTRAINDPTVALRGALTTPIVKNRAALTEWDALRGLMRAIEGFEGQPTTKAALKLMAYLTPRPGELRQAEWPEFDLEAAIWTVPATRMKVRRPHRVPIPSQAIAVLRWLKAITGHGRLAFVGYGVGSRSGKPVEPRPISSNTMNGALRRLGFTGDEMTSHGFRAAFSTLANQSGKWNPDAIERQLAHIEGNDVRRAYMRGEFWEERIQMMQWWASELQHTGR